jgi:hypothetical protein
MATRQPNALEAQSRLVAIDSVGEGLSLGIVVSGERYRAIGMFQSLFTSNRLCLPIIELPVRVNMEPAPSLIVLVSLDIARLALPIVGAGFIGKCSLDRCIMPEVYLGLGLSLFVCGILSFVLELPPLFFVGLLSCVGHRLLLGLGVLDLCLAAGFGNLDSGGFADVGAEAFGKG